MSGFFSLEGGWNKRGPQKAGYEEHPLTKKPKVAAGSDRATGTALETKPEHATFYSDKPMINQEIMTPAPPINALASTSYFSFILENKTGGVIEDWTLRFKIQFEKKDGQPYEAGCNNRVHPLTQWFERIEWIDRMTGEEIVRYHGDVLHMMMNTLPQEDLKEVEQMVNIDRETGRTTQREFRHNEIVDFYLPLVHHWFEGMDIDLGALRSDLEIRFYPRGSIFVEDQTALGNLGFSANLLELRMIQGTKMYNSGARVDLRKAKMSSGYCQNYLDFQQYIDYGRFFVPNQEYTIDLDQFHNDCACILLLLRRSGVQRDAAGVPTGITVDPYQGQQLYKFESLGEQGTIDHENVHGRSLFGDGTPVDELFFRKRYPTELFNNDYALKNSVYVIPFSNNLQGMLNGEIDGFHRFRGERERLRIRTGPEPIPTNIRYYMVTEATEAAQNYFGPTAGAHKNTLRIQFKGSTVATSTDRPIVLLQGLQDGEIKLLDLVNQINDTKEVKDHNIQVARITVQLRDQQGNSERVIRSSDADGGILTSTLAAPNGNPMVPYDPVAGLNTGEELIKSIYLEVTDLDGQPETYYSKDLSKMFNITFTSADGPVTATEPAREAYSDPVIAQDLFEPGKRGFNAGVYDITLYAVYYRKITEVRGHLKASDVVN